MIDYYNEIIPESRKSTLNEEDNLHRINIFRGLNFKIKEGQSNNYMDYIENRVYFHKEQIELMRKECNILYN